MRTVSDEEKESDEKIDESTNGSSEKDSAEISLAEMDEAVKLVKEKRDEYKAKKEESDDAHAELKRAEAALIAMMEKAEKEVYIVTGVGRVRVSHELSVQTPKTREEKLAFFKWLAEKKGQDVADNYMTINANSLNSLYKELNEEAAQQGEILIIDGLGEPVVRTTLSMTRA
jgi:hypothetical protein